MAFVATFGLEVGLAAISILPALVPPAQKNQCKVGIGSQTRDSTGLDLSGGEFPQLFIYDTRGAEIMEDLGGSHVDPALNDVTEFQGSSTTTPEYMKIQAVSSDAVCVSYISLTSAANDQRTWHAGYVKQCMDIANNSNIWYPSPELIPGTDFRPGCIWLSLDDRFLQAVTFKLTDFGFPDSTTATTAQKQYAQFPNTLCQAPARMAMWTKAPVQCIPFYDFDEEKNATTGFDLDFQRIPGQGPRTLTPQQIIDQRAAQAAAQAAQDAASAAGTNTDAPPDGSGNFGGTVGSISNTANMDPGTSTMSPADGVGNFGGIVGSIPKSTTKRSFSQKARAHAAGKSSHEILARREVLRQKQDYCVDRLVISHLKEHSATEVCETAGSWGPDFVSVVEGIYCDLCERELWQICDSSSALYCFDLDTKNVRYPQ